MAALAYEWQQQKSPPRPEAPALERHPAGRAARADGCRRRSLRQPVPEPAPAPVVAEKPPPAAPAVAVEKKTPARRVGEKTAAGGGARKDAENPLAPGTHRIVLRTEGEAWLEVKDGAGRMLISSLNPAGTERVVRGRAPFDIVIGNASSVKLTYDGKPVDLRPHTKVEVARFTLK